MSHRRHIQALKGRWETDFDQGGATSALDTGSIRITPRQDFNSQWLWFAIRSDQMGGKTPHFLIAKASRRVAPEAYENLAVWSTAPDTNTWNKFTTQTIGASDIEFYNAAPFPNGPVYVSFIPMYPFSRTARVFREWIKDSRVTLKYAGQATPRSGAEGRRAPGAPYYGLAVTNTNANTKNNMVLTAGVHPDETQGRFQLEGAMSWLLGGSPEAEFLLDWFNVFVYPCVNPQGVIGGYYRSSPQTPASDNNRIWETTGTNEAVDAFKTAIDTDTGGDIEVAIDYHGGFNIDATGYIDTEDHTDGLYAVFFAKMQGYLPTYTYIDETVTNMLIYVLRHTYTVPLAFVAEGANKSTQTFPTDWITLGQNTQKSIAAMQAGGSFTNGPGVGSRDFNGSTDRIDWGAVSNLTAGPITISAWINSDGFAGNSDYVFCAHVSGDSGFGIVMSQGSTTKIILTRQGSTFLTRGGDAAASLSGAWHHALITHDGTFTDYTTIKIYIDGSDRSNNTGAQNGSSETAATGSWSIGGRKNDDARNYDGKIAQVAVWNRVLTSTEIANLAAGHSPDMAAASNLLFYFKGNTSSLYNAISGGAEGTADGTSSVTGVGNGPTIYYP
jgi:hypothetical protein